MCALPTLDRTQEASCAPALGRPGAPSAATARVERNDVVAEAGSREVLLERFGQAPARAVIPPERSAAGVAGEAGTEDIAEAA